MTESERSGAGRPAQVMPGPALDPRVALSTCLHAGPGVYALLLGSGVSTGAGVATGWQVITQLVRAAAAAAPRDASAPDPAADPEAWWLAHGDGQPLGYSNLLAALAPTPAARQMLLAPFFEPTDADRVEGRKVPSAAHRAIAQLVGRGTVRAILTTNFDRLAERACEDAGISPQVLHRSEQVPAATPLGHARATIIKLHGDYADLEQRNTVDELDTYPQELDGLLRNVLADYGLIICGWSADWDQALVRALEETRPRRYPMFWAAYGQPSEAAGRLIAQHQATLIAGQTADDFFRDLVDRLNALDRLADAPVSRDMTVARLKQALPNPIRRIEVFDLIDEETSRVLERIRDRDRHPVNVDQLTHAFVDDQLLRYRGDIDTLLHLAGTGVFHDDGGHTGVWVRTVNRLLTSRDHIAGQSYELLDNLRHYPALQVLWVAGVAAILAEREDTLAGLLLVPTYRPPFEQHAARPAVRALHPYVVFDHEVAMRLPRWNRTQPHPESRILRSEGREPLRLIQPDDLAYEEACDRLEYLASLLLMDEGSDIHQPWSGEFAHDTRWDAEGHVLARRMKREFADQWAFLATGAFDGSLARAQAAASALDDWLASAARRR